MPEKTIPVYLFLGFLEAGKTKFIQKTMENERFGKDENILLLLCEEGVEDYEFSRLSGKNISLHVLEEKTDIDAQTLNTLAKDCDADIVVVEYNGMWHLLDLLVSKPSNWKIFQTVFVADASSFPMYVNNMKSLIVDKVNVSDVVIFNRYVNRADVNELHKTIRSITIIINPIIQNINIFPINIILVCLYTSINCCKGKSINCICTFFIFK